MRIMKAHCCILLAAITLVCVSSCGDDEDAAMLRVYNYPNPFTYDGGTTIAVKCGAAANPGDVLEFYLYIYDLNGFPVVVQRMTESSNPASFTIGWNAANERGIKLAPGVYVLKVTTVSLGGALASYTATHKMMVK